MIQKTLRLQFNLKSWLLQAPFFIISSFNCCLFANVYLSFLLLIVPIFEKKWKFIWCSFFIQLIFGGWNTIFNYSFYALLKISKSWNQISKTTSYLQLVFAKFCWFKNCQLGHVLDYFLCTLKNLILNSESVTRFSYAQWIILPKKIVSNY